MRIGVSRRKFVVVEISLNPRLIELLTLESALVTFQAYRVSVWMSWLDLESAVNRGWKISNFRTNTVTQCTYVSLLHPPYWHPNRVLGVLIVVSKCTGQWIRVIRNCGWKYRATATYWTPRHLSTCRLDIRFSHSPLSRCCPELERPGWPVHGVFIWSTRRNMQFIVWYVVVGDDWNKEPVWVIAVILEDVRCSTLH